MDDGSDKINVHSAVSNNEKLTENDILSLLILMKKGRISNPKLLEELNLKGSELKTPESAGHHRRKLEKMGVIEGYPAKINWKKAGFPTEFVVTVTAYKKEVLLEIQKGHVAAVKEYRKQTSSDIFIIPISDKGDKIILKDVLFGGDKPIAIISGMATDDGAAMMYADFYLPKRYPGVDTTLLIIKRSTIRDFEFQDEFIESLAEMIFHEGEIDMHRNIFKKEFRWDFLKYKINNADKQ